MTHTTATGKVLQVREANGRFLAFSTRAMRWLPVKRSEVQF